MSLDTHIDRFFVNAIRHLSPDQRKQLTHPANLLKAASSGIRELLGFGEKFIKEMPCYDQRIAQYDLFLTTGSESDKPQAYSGVVDLGYSPEAFLDAMSGKDLLPDEARQYQVISPVNRLHRPDERIYSFVSTTTINYVPNNGFEVHCRGNDNPIPENKGGIWVSLDGEMKVFTDSKGIPLDKMHYAFGCPIASNISSSEVFPDGESLIRRSIQVCGSEGSSYWHSTRDLMGFIIQTSSGRTFYASTILDSGSIQKIDVPEDMQRLVPEAPEFFPSLDPKILNPVFNCPVLHTAAIIQTIGLMKEQGLIGLDETVTLVSTEENDSGFLYNCMQNDFAEVIPSVSGNVPDGSPMLIVFSKTNVSETQLLQ